MMEARNLKIGGELNFSRSRKVGSSTVIIGKTGQMLERISLQTTENCAVHLCKTKIQSVAGEVLDRLAGRSTRVYLLSRSLTAGEMFQFSGLILELPIELRVMGAPPGKLSYEAFIQEAK